MSHKTEISGLSVDGELETVLEDYANFKIWESQHEWEEDFDRKENLANERKIAVSKITTHLQAAVKEARIKAQIKELAFWQDFFLDDSMNDKTPSERLGKRINDLNKQLEQLIQQEKDNA